MFNNMNFRMKEKKCRFPDQFAFGTTLNALVLLDAVRQPDQETIDFRADTSIFFDVFIFIFKLYPKI